MNTCITENTCYTLCNLTIVTVKCNSETKLSLRNSRNSLTRVRSHFICMLISPYIEKDYVFIIYLIL